jgi:AcrR family transcriptional regulator
VPRVVDHDERRDEIVAAAARVIAREGMDAATVRRIAVEAGYSSGVLDHYFHGKDDILLSALQASHDRIRHRVGAALKGRIGLEALHALLEDNLPLDEQRRDETRLEMQFWARSAADATLAAVQQTVADELRRAVLQRLGEAAAAGELPAALDLESAADRLLTFVDGLSVRAVLYPAALPAGKQRAMLALELAALSEGTLATTLP